MEIYKNKTAKRRIEELRAFFEQDVGDFKQEMDDFRQEMEDFKEEADEVTITNVVPPPTEELRGKIIVKTGAKGVEASEGVEAVLATADEVWICLKDSSDNYAWNKITKVAMSNNALLSTLKVDTVEVEDFDEEEFYYIVELPFGTETVPTVTATADDENATVVITAAEDLPGMTTVKVTSEDGTIENIYEVEFTIAPEDGNE